MSAHSAARGWAHRQGWTDATLLDLALTFIDEQGGTAFDEYLAKIAGEENAAYEAMQ